jgi:ectoine hydroxylase-related dioxygenase (phytanoyl-CoA dioxygenase family)
MPAAALATPDIGAEGAPLLTDAQLASFKENGYLSLDRITSPEDAANIRNTLVDLFERKAGHEQGAYFNFAGNEKDKDAPSVPQIMAPRNFAGDLAKSEFRRNATRLAEQILGPEVRFHVDHTLMKPALTGAATPWHQDEAFKDPKMVAQEISFWMPLQPVNEVNGCMMFAPGTNRGEILPHRTPGNDPGVHAIEIYEGVDMDKVVSCPLPTGGCTIHTGRTAHGAGPNRSDAPRYAYVLIFQTPGVPVANPRTFPWLDGKKTDRMKRQEEWNKSGGKFVQIYRKYRDKEFRDYVAFLGKIPKKIAAKFGSKN